MKFAFIEAEKANFPVAALCRILQVSRQGYYRYAKRPDSPRVRSDAALQQAVRNAHDDSEQRYGSPRVLRALQRDGIRVGKRRVERAMRAMGLCARPRSQFRPRTTIADPSHPGVPNPLDRAFHATRPHGR